MTENGIWAVCNNSSLGIKRGKFNGHQFDGATVCIFCISNSLSWRAVVGDEG